MNDAIKRGLILAGVVTPSFAAGSGTDYSSLTGAIDLTTLITAILAVALVAIGFVLAKGGAKAIINMVTGAVK